jgi:SAM-dependent methyltransferase
VFARSAATENAVAEDVPGLSELQKHFDDARARGDYEQALGTAEKMVDLTYPLHVGACYDVAAMHCRLGHKEKAYEWLKVTFEAGYGTFAELRKDEDFASIRDEDRFKKMIRETHLTRYLEMLERADRDDFQKPQEVMAALAFKPGEKVADVGAGSGYFTIPIAKAVGPDGVVWAIDIRKEFLDYIAARLEEDKLENVRLQQVYPDDPQLPQGKVDTILMVDTWHYIRDPEYAKKLRAGLAAGGRVVIIDYVPKPWEERPWGPPPEQHTPVEEITKHFEQAGLKLVESRDFLPEQYYLVFGAE